MGGRMMAVGAALTLVMAACGGGSDDPVADAIDDAIQSQQNNDGGDDGGDDGGGSSGGGSGTATASVNGGDVIEMTITDPCLIMDIGIGANAEGNGGRLSVGGFDGAANVDFQFDGAEWFAVAANVVVDGQTMSYEGPVGGTEGEGTISVSFMCTELVTIGG